jgi:hypothetical protein
MENKLYMRDIERFLYINPVLRCRLLQLKERSPAGDNIKNV